MSIAIIDHFNGRGEHNKTELFLLLKENGKYSIKRGNTTLLLFSEEEKARNGFYILRQRRGEY